MAGVSGRETAHQIHKLRPGLKVIYISGYILAPGVTLWSKPFATTTLAAKLREVLET